MKRWRRRLEQEENYVPTASRRVRAKATNFMMGPWREYNYKM